MPRSLGRVEVDQFGFQGRQSSSEKGRDDPSHRLAAAIGKPLKGRNRVLIEGQEKPRLPSWHRPVTPLLQ